MKPSINLRYKSLLLTCLLILSAGAVAPAWGQKTYTINYKNGSPQTGITERVDTVYVADGVPRELFIPELRYNTDPRYYWYVRWYMVNEQADTLVITNNNLENIKVEFNNLNPPQKGGSVGAGTNWNACLRKTSDGKSLFMYFPLYDGKGTGNSSVGASTVRYTATKVEPGITVVCDLSLNVDYLPGGTEAPTGTNITITEPSLSVRYKFVVRPASEIADRIKISRADDHTPFVEQNIETSYNKQIDSLFVNVQVGATANNYAWYQNYSSGPIIVGKNFRYSVNGRDHSIDGRVKNTLFPFVQVIDSLLVTETTTVDVWAVGSVDIDGEKVEYRSPLLARYIITPIEGSGFMLEDDAMMEARMRGTLDPKRDPDNHPELYERIGYINFDRNDTIDIGDLNSVNNIAEIGFPTKDDYKGKWLENGVTGYAPFDYQNSINKQVNLWGGGYRLQTLQNQYGLFRTAEVKNVSTKTEGWGNMQYKWFFNDQNPNPQAIYDRTYYNTGKKSLGYFFYVDAANMPGRLVKIKLDGEVCQHTSLLVNFWVNDMTTCEYKGTDGPLPPNINLLFIGEKKDGTEVVLHRFTSGDVLTSYTGESSMKNPANVNIGKWQQLMYTFSVSQRLQVMETIIWKYKTTRSMLAVRTTPSMVCVSTAPSPRST